MELRVWGRYIVRSDGNMKRAHDDSLIDEYELYVAGMEFLGNLQKSSEREASMKELEEDITKLMVRWKAAGLVKGTKRLQIADLSRQVGLGELYKGTFKLLSKLVHPTSAMMVTDLSSQEQTKSEIHCVFVLGTQCAAEVLQLMIKALGMEQGVDTWVKLHQHRSGP